MDGRAEQKGGATMTRKGIGILCMLAFLLPAAAWAQQKGSIELKSIAQVEVTTKNAKGEKEVKHLDVAKTKVLPGDTVVFTTIYKNIGKKPAEQVVITNPVPDHMDYIGGSAEGNGAKIDFSVTKGRRYGSPAALTIRDAQGHVRKAKPNDYTTIRWTVIKPIAPGAVGRVSFKAKVQ